MLTTIDRNDDSRISAEETDFHPAEAIKRDRQIGIQLKSPSCLRQRFQTAIEKRLGRTSRAFRAFGF